MDNTPEHHSGAHAADEVVDLRWVVHSIWHHRVSTLLCAVLGAVLGFSLSWLNTQYYSQGLLLTPSVTVADYKHYQAVFGNERRMRQFLELNPDTDPEVVRQMLRLVEVPDEMAEAIRPEFTYTDRDAKQYGVRFEEPGDLVGISLRLLQQGNGASVITLAEYVRDIVITVDAQATMLSACIDNSARAQALRNEQIDRDFRIAQQESKVAVLGSLIQRAPNAGAIDTRQIVSLRDGAELFLSPATQLVGAEMRIEELRAEGRRAAREAASVTHKKNFYCTANEMLSGAITGRAFIDGLKKVQADVFKDVDMSVDVNEQVSNELDLLREQMYADYVSEMRFVASPEGSIVRVRKPGRLLGLIGGGVLGLTLGVFLSLMMTWWRHNREAIVADE